MATTWFAQNSSVNIDSASQWNSVAGGGGTVLTFANLDPTDTLVANGKTSITCNVSFVCAEIRTLLLGAGASGGSFLLAAGVTVTANVLAGTSICLTRSAAGASSSIIGNVTGGTESGVVNSSTGTITITGNVTGSIGGFSNGILNSSTGTVTITGNVIGGSNNQCKGISNSSTGTVTITGNVTGGSFSNNFDSSHGISNSSTGTVTIIGNVTGGSATNVLGIYNSSTGTINITGNVTGGTGSSAYGVNNASTGTVTITGDAIAGTAAIGAINSSTGTLRVYGFAVGNDHGLGYSTNIGAPGVSGFGTNAGANQATTTVRGIKYGAKGQSPTVGLVQLEVDSLATSYASFRGVPATFTEYIFGPQEYIGGQPSEANVRSGTTYNFAMRTGTLLVPAPQYVNAGVGTDNTVGTLATPTAAAIATAVWTNTTAADFTTALSIGKSIMNGVSLGTGLTVTNLTNAPTSGDLTAAMKASVHTEVLNSLSVDTFPELSGVPAATSTLKDKLSWIFMWSRNKSTETSSERKLYADNTTTVVSTETVSDNGTTFTKDEAS